MSSRHLFNDPSSLVHSSLKACTLLNPQLRCHETSKSIYRVIEKDGSVSSSTGGFTQQKVVLIAGGGAGHEPAHGGYVGKGMLNGAVSGDIFASPSASQIEDCIRLSLEGSRRSIISSLDVTQLSPPTESKDAQQLLIIINNYTGDRLNFGLAIERVRNWGQNIEVESVVVADDVSVGRTQSGKVGRRGLAGNILVCKILGAAAERGLSLKELKKLGDTTVKNLASIGLSLDHCHVPGRSANSDTNTSLPARASSLGMGLHNEPGVKILDPTPPPRETIGGMLDLIFEESAERGYVDFQKHIDGNGKIVLFVNNLGGMSVLEMGGVVYETVCVLESKYHIRPSRVLCSSYMTSLNGPGFSLSLLDVGNIESDVTNVDVLGLIDDPTDAIGWCGPNENVWRYASSRGDDIDSSKLTVPSKVLEKSDTSKQVNVDQRTVNGVKHACRNVLEIESELTEYDTVVGDGDCGGTWSKGARGILNAIEAREVDFSSNSAFVASLALIVENQMGGTSGALFALYLTALSRELSSSGNDFSHSNTWIHATKKALSTLSEYTPAQPGDRTLVDAVHPFVHALVSGLSLNDAVDACRKGAESTKGMKPKLGRSVYVGSGDENTGWKDVPDPGAWGVLALVNGLRDGSGPSHDCVSPGRSM